MEKLLIRFNQPFFVSKVCITAKDLFVDPLDMCYVIFYISFFRGPDTLEVIWDV